METTKVDALFDLLPGHIIPNVGVVKKVEWEFGGTGQIYIVGVSKSTIHVEVGDKIEVVCL